MIEANLLRQADDGFTLVETIVAFLVLAIAMGVATQTINIATIGIKRSIESDQLIELANSIHLIEVPKLIGAGLASTEGADQRGRWKVKLSPKDGQAYRPGSFIGFTSIEVSGSSNMERTDNFVYFDILSVR
ncbi:prepilin-type N-terminal cleavage/methylation domain-containing protein [Rhizobium sp. SG741]|uniref:type IV pilus modification PilV family protein n=1 Tax=Rhizobium sp. SG741 TaxID=2587114 RepID=UPI0014481585|nr:prepilin-type N-terminal cleavage/methylation domain-containing protein [Rhizobium sp. SG741]NKJ09005.1 prepilin-type N-terminal cleavage/methylation domain-containing protein [Rhizobium sp. SG741]